MPMEPRELKVDVIKEFYANEDERGNKMVLRIVSWNNGAPKLEKRSFYRSRESDEVKTGKAVGLTLEDVSLILDNKDEILELMKKK